MAVLANGGALSLALIPTDSSGISAGATGCTLVLRNQSDRSIWVNRRMAINHPVSPPHLREVDFLIQDAAGRLAEFSAKVRIGPPQPADYVELGPGQAVERSVDLSLWYDMASDQEYEVQAIYESYFVPESLKDAPVWTGRLASRTLNMSPRMQPGALAH